jgi:hypothetical protein
MKHNNFLIALALCIGLSSTISFAPYNVEEEEMKPVYIQPRQGQQRGSQKVTQQILSPTATASKKSQSWITNFWESAKAKAHTAAGYIPGYNYGVKEGYLTSIKEYSATRLLATLSTVMYGLVKAGYNYDAVFGFFMKVAEKLWDKATIANGLKVAITALVGSAGLADWLKETQRTTNK